MYKLSELEVWKSARKLRINISACVAELPYDEKFRLRDQLLRSSRSIAANIAEGHGRFHYQENIQFCRVARGSLYETIEHLTCAMDEQFISKTQFDELNDQLLHCLKILNGYIALFKKIEE
ncbi:MAG: four helix bundle protein [Balneolaceae bacterium]|nr:four helix bundle protein [Balneolaceae bacterium]